MSSKAIIGLGVLATFSIILFVAISMGYGTNNYLFQDGSTPLTANWNAGNYNISVLALTTTDALVTGQLSITTNGMDAGLIIGSDCNLYRSGTNTLRTDDHIWIGSNIASVGSIYGADNTNFGIYAETNISPTGRNLIFYVYDPGHSAQEWGIIIDPQSSGSPLCIFGGDISVPGTQRLWFRDTSIYLSSTNDGYMDLVADIGIRANQHFIPSANITYDLGSSPNNVWDNIYVKTVNSGDVVFANDWTLTEIPQGMTLLNQEGKTVQEWRDDGIFIPGTIYLTSKENGEVYDLTVKIGDLEARIEHLEQLLLEEKN